MRFRLVEDTAWGKDRLEKESLCEDKKSDTEDAVVSDLLSLLDRYGFVLDKRFSENPGRTMLLDMVHIQVINPNSYIDLDRSVRDQLREYISGEMLDGITDIKKKYDCSITWSFGADKDGYVTGGLDVWVLDDSLTEAKIADKINKNRDVKGMTKRAIQELKRRGGKYDDLAKEYKKAYGEDALKEDTVKTKSGKWTNRGDTGETHGKFRTKKEADAQRRAIFANWKK